MSFLSFFCCPSFQHNGLLVTSLALGFLLCSASTAGASLSWVPAALGLRAEVVSARLSPSHGIDVRRVYAPWFLSRHKNDLE